MACRVCKSDSGKTFNGEVAIHFPGLEGLDKPIVWGVSQTVSMPAVWAGRVHRS
jgi:hypothetical protein